MKGNKIKRHAFDRETNLIMMIAKLMPPQNKLPMKDDSMSIQSTNYEYIDIHLLHL